MCERDKAAEWKKALLKDLISPPFQGSALDIALQWHSHSLRLICQRPPLMQDYPDLSSRLRGAFGHVLKARSEKRAGEALPPAYEIFYNKLGDTAKGQEIVKPFILRGQLSEDHLIVELHLFGWACVYFNQLAECLIETLERGIALGPNVRQRVAVNILEGGEKAVNHLDVPQAIGSLALTFKTPIIVRDGEKLNKNPQALMKSMIRRVSAMARWQGFELQEDFALLHHYINELTFDERGMVETQWQRFSIRQKDRPIPMKGMLGSLAIEGPLTALSPIIKIAETCNTGSHATLGYGWFDAAFYP